MNHEGAASSDKFREYFAEEERTVNGKRGRGTDQWESRSLLARAVLGDDGKIMVTGAYED